MVALAVVATACEASDTPAAGSGRPAVNATAAPLLPASVGALPQFDFAAYERLLYELRGTPVVVNIWASWCGPCRTETPMLVAAARRYARDVQFLGVDFRDHRGAAAAFSNQHDVPYPSVFDPPGQIHDQLGFVGLPDTVFYGPDGQIVATWSGPLTAGALRQRLEPLVSAADH
jgi:cytochrome c biogenesis protein CcmG, thiol:disulfide interchange protein DsbE